MTILLSTLAVAFAAFCVWLTVRIVNRKERWAKWTLAGVIVLSVLYVLGYGLVCRLEDTNRLPDWSGRPLAILYSPMNWLFENGSWSVWRAMLWYQNLWSPSRPWDGW